MKSVACGATASTEARIEIAQVVTRDGETLFQAADTAVLVDAQGRPRRVPEPVAEALSRLAPG